MLLIFLDTETTGLDPEKHRILEIAYKVIDSQTDRTLVSYQTLICQPLEIWVEADPESLLFNGFTWDEIICGKLEKSVASEILNVLNQLGLREKGGVFICQNPSFDRAFFTQLISTELQRHNGWPYHWLDLASMYWGVRLSRDPEFSKKIEEEDISKNRIAAFYSIPEEKEPHRAMNGVDHLIDCYRAIFSPARKV